MKPSTLLISLLILLTSCVTTKAKHTSLSKSDSTHTEKTVQKNFNTTDQITTRNIQFTANKFTEIEWIRDTLFKDTIIYKPRIKIFETQNHQQHDTTRIHTRDTIYITRAASTSVKKETREKSKQKITKPSPILLSIPFIILIILVILYLLRKKIKL